MSDALSVTQLVRKMKTALQFEVGEVWVEGEVSNLRVQASGHRYFTIKDAGAQLSSVLFKGRSGKNGALVENGKKVQLFGEITIYEAMGRAQMIVSKVKMAGEGDLQAKFEELKQKLNAEGLFEKSHKKRIPAFPQKIGLVTSPSGAALQDMLNIFARRAPWVELYLYGVQVQGKGAERGIAKAITAFSEFQKSGLPEVDAIIVGRGGGSIEDLWNFNEEVVARAIHASSIPVISAVGHEIDFTIADFVADERAPTPSAAAEIAVPDGEGLRAAVSGAKSQLSKLAHNKINQLQERLTYLSESLERKSPENVLADKMQLLGDQQERLQMAYLRQLQQKASNVNELKTALSYQNPEKVIARYGEKLTEYKDRLSRVSQRSVTLKADHLSHLTQMLKTIGPESTLSRGYSITTREDGSVVLNAEDLKKGDRVKTRVQDGTFDSTVD